MAKLGGRISRHLVFSCVTTDNWGCEYLYIRVHIQILKTDAFKGN